ncbi:hypothetical protein FQA39_LY05801 [Lamprigera yunnana]|nr:hypothetical protein FQA39_LY05801 [Lamprigera yunnana]
MWRIRVLEETGTSTRTTATTTFTETKTLETKKDSKFPPTDTIVIVTTPAVSTEDLHYHIYVDDNFAVIIDITDAEIVFEVMDRQTVTNENVDNSDEDEKYKTAEDFIVPTLTETLQLNNFKVVYLDGMFEIAKAMKSLLYETTRENIIVKTLWMDKLGITFTELNLNLTNVQEFLRKKQHFDLVIMHQFVSDAYTGFCYHYKAPCVAITSLPIPSWINKKI